ncbi:MAG: M23 family metallopeptidase [Bacteroidia bacterium]|nr:M23 family metallopeptidase [Bacteroidia bacterium]MBT8277049.1 M23 family metallopeptidase [Bacteroidia bacterium]NNF30048.1 M23 family metallopeptidase [Flavobacteriaceae bacterium]NNK55632.1 M23 family metallopeptidase [Flavobacteriaceae bacterium]NNM09057.1 M23 family metallopeptidase [Flavobacteriaceae bacterium]
MRLLFFTFLLGGFTHAQSSLPQDYFDDPLKIPIILSGSFGELRSNHFHSGLDIKTQQREGIPVYAPADGVVTRIKVSHYGYGKALYIAHPNGYSTVYAHLQRYEGVIQEYVKSRQYARETYEVELFPDAGKLKVNRGDIIGYTGNSGSSGGPHLHFEIRDGSSRPMNPMLFGIEIPDGKKPLVNTVFAYPLDEKSHIDQSQNRVKLRLILQKDGTYKTENISAFGRIGFGISTYDQQDGASNKNGVYKIKTTFNGRENFNVTFDKFSFGETRYLNRFIDYHYWRTNKSRVQKLFRESNNPLSIITKEENSGYLSIEDGLDAAYTIEIMDFKGNKVNITVPIKGKNGEILKPKEVNKTDDYIYADQATSISKGKFNIYIPANSLYEDSYLNIEAKGDILVFHEDNIPIHKNISITVDASNYKKEDLNTLYLGRLNYKGEPYYHTTYRKGNKLTAKTRTFGSFTLVSDTTAPSIKPANFADGKWISKNNTLKVKIEDDLSGIGSYRATINGKYILMEYNYKKDVLTYNFNDNIISETENNLKVNVVDNAGNNATFEATFFRK